MNDAATLPISDDNSRRSAGIADAATPSVAGPVVDVAGDVMTCDPDRVAGSDTLLEVCDQDAEPGCGVPAGLRPRRCPPGHHRAAGPAPRRPRRSLPPRRPRPRSPASPAVTIGVNEPVDNVPDLMAQRRMWLLPVLDGRRLVGVIHYAIGAAKLSPRPRLNRSRPVIPALRRDPERPNLW